MAGIAVSPFFSVTLRNQRQRQRQNLPNLCLRQGLSSRPLPCYISAPRMVPVRALASYQNLRPSPQSPPLNLIQTLARTLLAAFENARCGFARLREVQPGEAETISSLQSGTLLQAAVAPLCFAAISRSASINTPLTVVASGMAKWLELYSGVLMVRVLLSWFPNIPWERQPLQAMRDMCDPYLNLFRNIIPPVFNALDLSPLLAFLVLGLLTSVLNTTIQA